MANQLLECKLFYAQIRLHIKFDGMSTLESEQQLASRFEVVAPRRSREDMCKPNGTRQRADRKWHFIPYNASLKQFHVRSQLCFLHHEQLTSQCFDFLTNVYTVHIELGVGEGEKYIDASEAL